MRLQQAITQTQHQSLNMQFVQSLNILQMSAGELMDFLQEQAEDHPVMQVVYPDDRVNRSRKTGMPAAGNARSAADPLLQLAGSQEESLERMLVRQLRLQNIPVVRRKIAEFMAGNLNDDGLLTVTVKEVCRFMKTSEADAAAALSCLQALDPAGVGARTFQECLLMQIDRDPDADPWAAAIVGGHLQKLAAGKLREIAAALGISTGQAQESLRYIRTLNPRPGLSFSQPAESYVEPDAFIHKAGDRFVVTLNERYIPKVSIDTSYTNLINESDCKETKTFIRNQMVPVQWLIRNLEQRQRTLNRVLYAIVEEQQLFLDQGPVALKPLTLSKIAEKVNLNLSSVSRAVRHKYVQLPSGVYPLKIFFSAGLGSRSKEEISSLSVQARISELIRQEDKSHPLSDQQITDILVAQGVQISRRTVMKYREKLRIPSSRLRCS